jgi:diguanylate cyclase (GGDEF)-like protein
MHIVAVLTKVGLVYIGAIFLIFALFPIRELIAQLPKGKLKTNWITLATLIVIFIVGYLFYATDYWLDHDHNDGFDLVVPFIFFFGGIFVFLVGKLSLKTASDMRKMAILEHQSITDSLMGINNRRYFDQALDDEVEIAKRYGLPLALILVDVDRFKDVNDTHGHLIGDEVLRNLAKAIKNIARESDVVCRYGGEEIAIITPNTSLEKAMILAKRLNETVKKSTMALSGASQEEIYITISLGVSSLDFGEVSCKENLLQRADNALYDAKRNGRDRVVTLQDSEKGS